MIGKMIQVDLTEVAQALSAGDAVEVGHNIAGNRLRMSKSEHLRSAVEDWSGALSAGEQRLFWALVGWLMPKYGYKKCQ